MVNTGTPYFSMKCSLVISATSADSTSLHTLWYVFSVEVTTA